MRAFAIFTGLIALGLAGIAFLGYPAWLLISPFLDNPKFHRISSRVGMALLAIGFVIVVRRLKMADRQSLGFGLPTREFIAQVFKALAFGILLMMPALLTMLVLDMRQWVGEPLSMIEWIKLALGAVITGLTVALIEETFLRGAMQFAITRESGARVAIVLTSLVYAATHFIDAFLCLVAVGILLGMARQYTGNIAACIGLHAGWVAVIYVVNETSKREVGSPLSWMLSNVNGFLGWMVLGWTVVIGILVALWYRRSPRRTIP